MKTGITTKSYYRFLWASLFVGLLIPMPVAASPIKSNDEAGAAVDSPLIWNTFLGASNGDDWGTSMAMDGSGNIYVMGTSLAGWGCDLVNCTVHPASYYDVFVAKLDSSGMLQWNTFLGGSGIDTPGSIALDDSGNIYVGGTSDTAWSCSPTPCTGRAFTTGSGSMSWEPDGFAAKLDSNGVLQWNSFLGGNTQDLGGGIAVDGAGNVYAAGYGFTPWSCSPTPCTVRAYTAGYSDAFVAKLNSADGALVWNAFLGSSDPDDAVAAQIDAGSLYILGGSGTAWGAPVRGFSGSSDAFVAKMDPSTGALQWHTFLGGDWYSDGLSFAVKDGSSYVAGTSGDTWGTPVRAFTGTHTEGFVAKVNPNGTLSWNTFLGGTGIDDGNGIAVENGSVYAVGYSDVTWGTPVRAFTASPSGRGDGFAAKLEAANGALDWNTFLGASDDDLGYGAAADAGGNVYATGRSESTWGAPISPFWGPYDEAFVASLPSIIADSTAPAVGAFAAMSPSHSLTIPITAFAASDNLGTTGYMITQPAMPPLPDDAGWVASAPATYAVANAGTYTLYPWARDAAGNVSALYPSPATVTVTLPVTAIIKSLAAQDGWVLEKSESSSTGLTTNNTLTTFRLGDDAARKQYRSILSFNTGPSLPDNAAITSVSLKIRRQTIIGGGNPINTFQGVIVELMKGTFGTVALEPNDFQVTAAASKYKAFGPYKPVVNAAGWYTITLPAAAKSYINKVSSPTGLTQIRLRFNLDDNNNSTANYLSLFSGNAPLVSQPQLIVQYTP